MAKKKLTPKQAGFVKDLVKTKNPTEAARLNYEVVNDNTASTIASENMRKPAVISAIDRALNKAKLTDDVVALVHARNLTQDQDLRVSQTAVKDFYAIKGYASKDTSNPTVNVAFIINDNSKKG